jgi:CBS domain-containing protein
MDTIGQILKEKGHAVLTAAPKDSVLQAVEVMCGKKVGSLIVCDQGSPIGIITERDLMTDVVLARRDPAATRVDEVMATDVVCVDPSTPAEEAMAIMTEKRCRHLPVVEGARIVGVISIGDLVRWASRNHEFEIRMLTDFIHGKYPG